jgi:hypothetical protein
VTRLDEIRARLAAGRVAVGLGHTPLSTAVLLDDIDWLIRELDAVREGT